MDNILHMLLLVGVMALVTYAIRVAPFVFFKKKIKSKFIKSVLYYIPYTVLIAMTFPAVFFVTGNVISGVVGTLVAVAFSLNKKAVMVLVALLAVVAVLVTEGLLIIL